MADSDRIVFPDEFERIRRSVAKESVNTKTNTVEGNKDFYRKMPDSDSIVLPGELEQMEQKIDEETKNTVEKPTEVNEMETKNIILRNS